MDLEQTNGTTTEPVEDKETVTETEQNSEETKNTYTQEDVNNVVARESKKATEKMLKELGIDDFENAKDGLEKFKEWQESQKTESEKQADELERKKLENEELTNTVQTLEAKLTAQSLGVTTEAMDDVIQLAKMKVDEETDIHDAIKSVVEKYPSFIEKSEEPKEEQQSKRRIVSGGNPTATGASELSAFDLARQKYKK